MYSFKNEIQPKTLLHTDNKKGEQLFVYLSRNKMRLMLLYYTALY